MVVIRRIRRVDKYAELVAHLVKNVVRLSHKPFAEYKPEKVAEEGGGGIDRGDTLVFKCTELRKRAVGLIQKKAELRTACTATEDG